VSSAVHNLTQQYAVISVRREPRPERFVIAYSNEQTLRDILAELSIVSFGYHSREEAIASLDECAPTGHDLPANLAAASVDMADRSLGRSGMAHPQFRCGFDLAKRREFVCGLLKNSFAAAASLFYSKNLLCMAIRAVISC
jgi:hypothetical protein